MSDFAERGNAFHVEKHFGEMEKAKSKARGVIGSSRRGGVIHLLFSSWDREPSPVPLSRGAYWGVLPEHKEPSPVFLCSMVLTCSSRLGGGFNLVFHRGTRNCPLSHAASTYDCICCCSVKICLGYGCMVPSLCNKSPAGLRITT